MPVFCSMMHGRALEVISMLRYCTFDEEQGYLLLVKNQTIEYR